MHDHDVRMKAMRFATPEYIPARCWFLPATWLKYREALSELVERHSRVFIDGYAQTNYDEVTGAYAEGSLVDEWGCGRENIAEGTTGLFTKHPLQERSMVHDFEPPAPGAGTPHGFMFLRLTYLRGFEEMMVDFAEEPAELQLLIDIVLKYNMGEIARQLEEKPDMIFFGDDLGTQTALPISPAKWRKYLKPCYAKMYRLCHKAGAAVYMHTDGHILPIIPDLIECGVNVLNPQSRANGLRELAAITRGKLCLNLDLDRQMFPFATPGEIDAHVREAVELLGMREGGLWLTAECAPDVPLSNIEAICQALERYQGYYS